MSLMLILAYGMRHQLSGVALSDLLVLIELHCLLPNQCKKSIKTIHDFFNNLKTPIEYHYFCQNKECTKYFGTVKNAEMSFM